MVTVVRVYTIVHQYTLSKCWQSSELKLAEIFINTKTGGPPTAYHLSDDRKGRMERQSYMWRRPEGETDASWFWQESLANEPKDWLVKKRKKTMKGTYASHLIHRHFLIFPCDQSSAAEAWVTQRLRWCSSHMNDLETSTNTGCK